MKNFTLGRQRPGILYALLKARSESNPDDIQLLSAHFITTETLNSDDLREIFMQKSTTFFFLVKGQEDIDRAGRHLNTWLHNIIAEVRLTDVVQLPGNDEVNFD